jgi:hypothetical protein
MPEQLYDYRSRRCAVADLDSRLRTKLSAEAGSQLLGDISAGTVGCVETRGVPRRRPGLFARLLGGGPLQESLSAAVLFPRHLLVAVTQVSAGTTTALAGRLDDMTVTEVDPRLAVDSGVTVFTRWSNSPEAGSLHLGLGDDPAGAWFKDLLRQAVQAAKSD